MFFLYLDIDECLSSPCNLTVFASCNNTAGSYKCLCRKRFHRYGKACIGMYMQYLYMIYYSLILFAFFTDSRSLCFFFFIFFFELKNKKAHYSYCKSILTLLQKLRMPKRQIIIEMWNWMLQLLSGLTAYSKNTWTGILWKKGLSGWSTAAIIFYTNSSTVNCTQLI